VIAENAFLRQQVMVLKASEIAASSDHAAGPAVWWCWRARSGWKERKHRETGTLLNGTGRLPVVMERKSQGHAASHDSPEPLL